MATPDLLKAATPEELAAMRDRLIKHGNAAQEARTAREMYPEAAKRTEKYVAKRLRMWRAELIEEVLKTMLEAGATGALQDASTMEAMRELIAEQQVRVAAARKLEKSSNGLLMQAVSSEMSRLFEMYNKLASIEMETGIIRRAPKTITGSSIDENGAVTQFSWKEEQEQLHKLLEGTVVEE